MTEHTQTKVALDLALWRLQEQIAYRGQLDGRLGHALTLGAAMIALLGSAFLIGGEELGQELRTGFTVASGLFVGSILTATAAYLTSRFAISPNLIQLRETLEQDSYDEFALLIAGAVIGAVERNETWLQLKLWLVNLTISLTAAAALTLVISLVLLL